MPEGETLAITQTSYFTGKHYWDSDGERARMDRFKKWEIQPYLEHGLSERVTVGGSFFMQRVQQAGANNTGIADPEFFARAKLWQGKRSLLSVQPLIKLPSRFEHNDRTPRGGSKSTDFELSLLYGESLNIVGPRDYLDVRVGYRDRTRHLHGQYRTDVALGMSPWEGWLFVPALRSTLATGIPDHTRFSQSGDLDYDLLKAELTIAYQLPSEHWVQATWFDHLEGAQTGDGTGLSVGYAVRF